MAEDNGSAPAGNPAPEAGAAPAPAGAAPAASTDSWIDSVADTDIRGWAETKGLNKGSFENVLSSYRNLEKMVGADKAGRTVVLPGPEADDASMNEFYGKLGRPAEAKDYALPVPEGQAGDMAEWASGVFHKAGLSKKQAEMVAGEWNSRMGRLQEAAQTHDQQTAQQAEAELRKEWGAAYDQKLSGIDRAAETLGMNSDQLAGLRNSMGPVAAMKFVDALNGRLGDDGAMDHGENKTGGLMTPASAIDEMKRLGTDKDFMDAWMNKQHPSHQWAVEKKSSLARMAAGVSS